MAPTPRQPATTQAPAQATRFSVPKNTKGEMKKLPKASSKSVRGKDTTNTEDEVSKDGVKGKAGGTTVKIRWEFDDHKLSWKLVNTILDDPKIKQGLFPSPGTNTSTSKGGGKQKADFHWAICLALFGGDLEYGVAFDPVAESRTAKEKRKWTNKIKNHLRTMATMTWELNVKLGTTGEGVKQKEDIWQDTKIANIWDANKALIPWYWHMKGLILEHPNLVPVGLGNSTSKVNRSVLLAVKEEESGSDGDDDGKGKGKGGGRGSSNVVDEAGDIKAESGERAVIEINLESSSETDSGGGTNDGVDIRMKRKKGVKKAKPSTTPKAESFTTPKATFSQTNSSKWTPACPGISIPTSMTKPQLKKAKFMQDFEEIAKDKEVTKQKALGVAKEKAKVEKSRYEIKMIRLQAKVEMRKEKLTLLKLKMEQDHAFCMASLQMGGPTQLAGANWAPAVAHAGPSHSLVYTASPATTNNYTANNYNFSPAANNFAPIPKLASMLTSYRHSESSTPFSTEETSDSDNLSQADIDTFGAYLQTQTVKGGVGEADGM
ncbi:hypothetical protein JAAARDRAFT_51024 [Jaapia argillacea MUCL 33604]|uniref:No apical meristem-associated C-terminal domain-containing protein n=1 Tax=Jaapia argillacea MUCL 33604 TaxID=933084 RepID=A0A067P8C5_9AGAM|nr:hypothetical protein JAAARDRAFT_51024 [Jaapia argillacea MUCL 33604]